MEKQVRVTAKELDGLRCQIKPVSPSISTVRVQLLFVTDNFVFDR